MIVLLLLVLIANTLQSNNNLIVIVAASLLTQDDHTQHERLVQRVPIVCTVHSSAYGYTFLSIVLGHRIGPVSLL